MHDINKSIFNRKQAKQSISRHPIFLTDSDNNYILEEIYCWENKYLERDVDVISYDEEKWYDNFKLI